MSDIRWIDNSEPARREVRGSWPFRYTVEYAEKPATQWMGCRVSDGVVVHEISKLPLGCWLQKRNGCHSLMTFATPEDAKAYCEKAS